MIPVLANWDTAWYAQESGVTSENGLAANAVVTPNTAVAAKIAANCFFITIPLSKKEPYTSAIRPTNTASP